MKKPRIISFLPAATEMVYALGIGDELVGVSHECDFPAEAKTKPIVVQPALALETMSLREIDISVAERIRSGESLYQVDEALIVELKPDLILTQDLCQVCATSGNDLASVLGLLEPPPQIMWMTPHSLTEIFENIRELGRATDRYEKAEALIQGYRLRLEHVVTRTRTASSRPRVFCMEWADPVYCSGHWVPEMVELAGGTDELGRKNADSVRIAWANVVKWSPEIIIFSPCGFNLEKAVNQVVHLESLPGWAELPAVRNQRVYAVDANSYYARPGPRVVEGTELLAHLIHPELFDWNGPVDAYQSISASMHGESETRIKICPGCHRSFECKMGGCWCNDLPPLPPAKLPGFDCYCSACLSEAVRP